MFIKMESFMRIKSILFVIPLLFLSCEEAEEQNAEDCAGIVGGNTICGCTDSDATNYNSEATYDDGSCCLLYTSPSPRDRQKSRMPSSA